MEYLDSQSKKINNSSNLDIEKLKAKSKMTGPKSDMTSFKLYTGKKSKKKNKKSSKKDLEQKEIDKGLTKREEVKPVHKKSIIFKTVSLTDKMLFMDNMSTMLRAGLSLTPALRTIKGEIKNPYFQEILDYLCRHIENGQTLSTGMKKYPKVFSEMVVSTVEVGENTGMLSDTFGHLADIMKRQKELRGKVVGAMMYPSIVILALLVVSGFLAMVIFPQLVDLFEAGGVELPFVLVAVRSFNYFMTNYWYYAIAILVALIVAIKIIFNYHTPKLLLHRAILNMPFIGKLNKELALTRFAGNLNALLAAGLGIVESMDIVSKTVGNLRYKEQIALMAKELEKGKSLQNAMEKRPDLFPSLTIQLIQVGETTGQLEEILAKIGRFYGDRVNNILDNLSTILEPFLLVVVGVAVGFIAVSVIGPMYELTNSFAE